MQIVHVLQAFHALITLLHRQGSLNQPGYPSHEQGTLRHALMELRAQRNWERETKQYTESASSIDLKVTRLSNLDVLVGGKK
jgi:hypothetical protein